MSRPSGGLAIRPRDLAAIHRHAASTYPEECCGILVGRQAEDPAEGASVERVLCAENAREDRRRDRFLIAPGAILEAHREARAAGLDVVGYYHSHPDHRAEPSEVDREHAWPGLSYVIVAVQGGKVGTTRSWRLTDDRLRFEEEDIVDPREERRAS
jgi:proteasome lid subunit RPN8/RPN11